MFDKFGEMNTEELNTLAKNLLTEGDGASIYVLAAENGLDRDDAEDFINGDTKELCNSTMLSEARLNIQKEHSKLEVGAREAIYTIASAMLMYNKHFADIFLKKGKNPDEVYKKLKEIAKQNKKGNVGVACGTDRDLEKIIMDYYEA